MKRIITLGKKKDQLLSPLLTTILICTLIILIPSTGQSLESKEGVKVLDRVRPFDNGVDVNLEDQPSILYGITFLGNELLAINSETAETTLIGTLSQRGKLNGLGRIETRYFTFTQYGNLIFEIDVSDGSVIQEYATNIVNSYSGEGAIAFKSDGTGYARMGIDSMSTLQQLYMFNLEEENSSLIGAPQGYPGIYDGLVFDENNTLYGLSQSGINLIRLDTDNGEGEVVGATGINISRSEESREAEGTFVGGLAATPAGSLYAIVGPYLYRISKTTGNATYIGDTGFTWISGLEFGYYIDDNENFEVGPHGEIEEPETEFFIPPKEPYSPDLINTVDPKRP